MRTITMLVLLLLLAGCACAPKDCSDCPPDMVDRPECYGRCCGG